MQVDDLLREIDERLLALELDTAALTRARDALTSRQQQPPPTPRLKPRTARNGREVWPRASDGEAVIIDGKIKVGAAAYRDIVAAVLAQRRPVTVAEIAAQVSKSPSTAAVALRAARERGAVRQVSRGVYYGLGNSGTGKDQGNGSN